MSKKGNKNAVGPHLPGGGRKSLAEEKSNAEIIDSMFGDEVDVTELKKKINKGRGKYSVKDAIMANALSGKEKVQVAIMQKRFPDKVQHSGHVDFNAAPYLE